MDRKTFELYAASLALQGLCANPNIVRGLNLGEQTGTTPPQRVSMAREARLLAEDLATEMNLRYTDADKG